MIAPFLLLLPREIPFKRINFSRWTRANLAAVAIFGMVGGGDGDTDKGNGRASFEDMTRALPQFGFKAQGFAASWQQLIKLRMPVVVYLKHRKDAHFSVIRGINADTVWLADPSLGNRTYSRDQFLAMWQTREEDAQHPHLRGKFLAVLLNTAEVKGDGNFFTLTPARQTSQAVEQLAFRSAP